MKKLLYRILFVICLGIFLFSAWQLYTIWAGSQQVKNETGQLESYLKQPAADKTKEEEVEVFSPDWAGLQTQNPDIIAWIIIPGTDISYPIVQGADNEYYLNYTALKLSLIHI